MTALAPLAAAGVLLAAWIVVLAWPSVRSRWVRRRARVRLSSFVLEDVRSRVGVREVGGSKSWSGGRR